MPTLWNNIESRLDLSLPRWRERLAGFGQLKAVEDRFAGRTWRDDEVFKGLLMAVLSANTEWSKIESVQGELADIFSGFRLEWYAERSVSDIRDRLLPWFKERKASSMTLERGLADLVGAAQILLQYSRTHGAADGYFTSLLARCGGDPKRAALQLGCRGAYKLPALGVPLAAEALKNLGFDVAKPDRHTMRAIGAFGLVHFRRWPEARDGRVPPVSTSRKRLLAVMAAVQRIAEAADKRVALVDNAIWLLCARSALHLTNPELAEIARQCELPEDRGARLGTMIRAWMEEKDAGEQRETIEHLVRALDEDRLSHRKLFPRQLKGKSW